MAMKPIVVYKDKEHSPTPASPITNTLNKYSFISLHQILLKVRKCNFKGVTVSNLPRQPGKFSIAISRFWVIFEIVIYEYIALYTRL